MNLRDALEHYLSDKPRSAATLRRYRDNLRAHFAALGGDDRDVTEVTRAEVVAWRNAQDQLGLSPWTVAGHARDVKAFWAWLARAGLIAVSPAATLKVPQGGASAPGSLGAGPRRPAPVARGQRVLNTCPRAPRSRIRSCSRPSVPLTRLLHPSV